MLAFSSDRRTEFCMLYKMIQAQGVEKPDYGVGIKCNDSTGFSGDMLIFSIMDLEPFT